MENSKRRGITAPPYCKAISARTGDSEVFVDQQLITEEVNGRNTSSEVNHIAGRRIKDRLPQRSRTAVVSTGDRVRSRLNALPAGERRGKQRDEK